MEPTKAQKISNPKLCAAVLATVIWLAIVAMSVLFFLGILGYGWAGELLVTIMIGGVIVFVFGGLWYMLYEGIHRDIVRGGATKNDE